MRYRSFQERCLYIAINWLYAVSRQRYWPLFLQRRQQCLGHHHIRLRCHHFEVNFSTQPKWSWSFSEQGNLVALRLLHSLHCKTIDESWLGNDFFLWGYLIDEVFKVCPRTLEELKAAIRKETDLTNSFQRVYTLQFLKIKWHKQLEIWGKTFVFENIIFFGFLPLYYSYANFCGAVYEQRKCIPQQRTNVVNNSICVSITK